MKEAYLKPRDGLRVRKPDGAHLPAEGASVPLNAYWRRRLNDGDVVKASPPRPPKKTQTKEAE